jgi:hypothetical protein
VGQRFGQGYLGDLGTRLQRLLGFDGDAGASFDSKAVPVLICGDATQPGYGSNNSRRFAYANSVASLQAMYFRAVADVIIDSIDIQVTSGAIGTATTQLVSVGTADPGTAAVGIFLDRSLSANDRPPLLGVVGVIATTGSAFHTLFTVVATPVPTVVRASPEAFCLAAGQAVVIQVSGPSVHITVRGQTL